MATRPHPRQGPDRPREPLRRPDPPDSRHRRAVQGSQRAPHQEGTGAPRQDDRQSLLRSLDPDPDLLRVRREAAVGRHRQRGRLRLLGQQGRDPGGHRPQPRGDADRHGGHPPPRLGLGGVPRQPDPVQRHQRRRRQARAPDAGAARPPDAARQVRQDRRPQGRHLRRLAPQPRGAEQHLGTAEAGGRGRGLRADDAAAPRHRAARRHGPAPDRGCHPVGRRAQRPPAAAGADDGGLHPLAPRVQPGLRGQPGAPREGPEGPGDHAPGADEPRSRDRQRRGRRRALGDPAAGDQRRGGPDGGALPAGRRRPRLAARRRRPNERADPPPGRPGHRSLAPERRHRRRADRRGADRGGGPQHPGSRGGQRARREGQGGGPRADRPARPPARARPGGPRDGRHGRHGRGGRRVHRRLRHAQHRPGHRQPGRRRLRGPPVDAGRARRGSTRSAPSPWARGARSWRNSARWSGPGRWR